MGTSVMPAKAPKLLPFAAGTRRHFVPIGQYAFTPGQPVPTITLPQTGLLGKIRLKLEGTITQTTAAGTIAPTGYSSLISRVRVNANLGSGGIVDVSGAGLEMFNYAFAPTAGPVKNTYGNLAAANQVSYGLDIPICANDRNLLMIGLIDLQAGPIRVTLDVIANALTSFITAGGGTLSSNLTLYVGYEYWEVPNPTVYALPPNTLCKLLEDAAIPITVVGDQIYQIPRLGTLLQMTEYFVFGANMASLTAPTPQINQLRLRANKTDTWFTYDARFKEMEEQAFYNTPNGSFMRPGTMTWDFFHSEQQTRNMGSRDLINTEAIAILESIATVDSTVVPAAGYTRNVVRRVTQRLV